MSARVAPGGLSELGLTNWLLCKVAALQTGVADVHLFSTLARQRGLFRAWLLFSAHMMPGGTLSRRDTELVILRVAQLRKCQYELDHHARIGRRVGIDALLLERLTQGPGAAGWNAAEQALLHATDELVRDKDLSDGAWAALAAHYRPAQVVELCLLVGQYEALATTIRALRIERDVR